ncbi:transposase [Streptomyces sp. IBSBF 2953]|nr:transposase [Streptomyces hayashii]
MAFTRKSTDSSLPDDPLHLYRMLAVANRGPAAVWGHQQDVLRSWHQSKSGSSDVAIELPTGAGKTLVGGLIAEFRRRTSQDRVAYLCPTRQLAQQTAAAFDEYRRDRHPHRRSPGRRHRHQRPTPGHRGVPHDACRLPGPAGVAALPRPSAGCGHGGHRLFRRRTRPPPPSQPDRRHRGGPTRSSSSPNGGEVGPDRRARRTAGKSDPIDAYAAATAVLAGRATGTPKHRDGAVEAIRGLRVVRASAVKARTQTINQIKSLIISAPAEVREALRPLTTTELVRRLAASRPATDLAAPATAVKVALKRLAKRYRHLSEEIADADADLRSLITHTAPDLLALPGVGTETAGQLLVTAGDNPDRLASEASFAHLCAAAPVPASSGRTDRHGLNRGGDRQANRALHTIVLVRMRHDPRTREYVARRTLEAKDIFRCLKRFVAREVYHHLTSAFTGKSAPSPTA